MSKFADWRRRGVFISSTFRDMQAERDYLQDVVFPRIEEQLRLRRHHLEAVDLRWGVETVSVADQHEKELQVLRVCLNDIQRCRPFLVVLLGDRYGWVPPADRMKIAAREHEFEGEVRGKSVTALEIEFGVLCPQKQPEQPVRAHFFFRRLNDAEMDAADRAEFFENKDEPARRLQQLKEAIEEQFPDRVHSYNVHWDANRRSVAGLEEFGELVFEHLWKELDEATREFAQAKAADWRQQERFALEAFVARTTRGFCGRESVLQPLIDRATPPLDDAQPWGVCIVGEPGAGKSTLLAELYRRLQAGKGTEFDVLAHAAGISPRSLQVRDLLLRWCAELADILGESWEGSDDENEKLQQEFAELLQRSSRRRPVVLLIDALNQFWPTPEAQHLTWLPQPWPAGARLICTSLPGPQATALGQREGVRLQQLEPFDEPAARDMIQAVCDRYHRVIGKPVTDALLARVRDDEMPSHSNPLWLEMAVEALNLLDSDDFRLAQSLPSIDGEGEDERLERLLVQIVNQTPPHVDELYAWLLQRSEEIVDESLARGFANLICLSRLGLRESDVEKLLSVVTGQAFNPLQFAILRRVFRAHLVQRGGEGFWDFFHGQMRQAVWRRNLRDAEEVRRLHEILAKHLLGLPEEDTLRQTQLMFHLLGWEDREAAVKYYSRLPDPSAMAGLPPSIRESVPDRSAELEWATDDLADFLLGRSAIDQILRPSSAELQRRLDWLIAWLPSVLDGRYETQILFLSGKFSVHLFLRLEKSPQASEVLRKLSFALQAATEQLNLNPITLNMRVDPAIAQSRVGDAALAAENVKQALQAYRQAERIFSEIHQLTPPDSGFSWVEARRNLAVIREKIGQALEADDDLEEALKAYHQSRQLREELDREGVLQSREDFRRDLTVTYRFLGNVFWKQEELPAALEYYSKGLGEATRYQLLPDMQTLFALIGRVQKEQGQMEEALAALESSATTLREMLRRQPNEMGWQFELAHRLGEIADLLMELGGEDDVSRALQVGQERLAFLERQVELHPSVIRWRELLAFHLWTMQEHCQALERVEEAKQHTSRCLQLLDQMEHDGNLPGALKELHGWLRREGTPTTASKPAPAVNEEELLTTVRRLIDAGRPQEALDGLKASGGVSTLCENARAVCCLHLNRAEEAVSILRPLVLQGLQLRSDGPVQIRGNYVLALLHAGNLQGAAWAVSELENQCGGDHTVAELKRQLDAIRRERGVINKLIRWLRSSDEQERKPLPGGEIVLREASRGS